MSRQNMSCSEERFFKSCHTVATPPSTLSFHSTMRLRYTLFATATFVINSSTSCESTALARYNAFLCHGASSSFHRLQRPSARTKQKSANIERCNTYSRWGLSDVSARRSRFIAESTEKSSLPSVRWRLHFFRLFSTSQDSETRKFVDDGSKKATISFTDERGDGSTGGGGIPMLSHKRGTSSGKVSTVNEVFHEQRRSEHLVRPKVGAEMPRGRPSWFRVPAPSKSTGSRYDEVKQSLKSLDLHTVCEEAHCPNIGECWNGGTGTIMLLGDTCTRGCMFCAVKTSSAPPLPDAFEPFKTAKAVVEWGVDYIVLTSVDRDDLPDGGAAHFAHTVELLKLKKPEILVECLVSDFAGNLTAVETLARSGLDVYAHNIETVERLQKFVRDARAGYSQSLAALEHAKASNPQVYTKTSLMLGLGETDSEVLQTMKDLRSIDVDVVTFGQYLRPTDKHLSVVEYVSPQKFEMFRQIGENFGFKYVASGPMVRSSYKAGEFFLDHMIKENRNQKIH